MRCTSKVRHTFLPNASQVAGYRKERSMSRYFCKDEKGIPILTPIFVRDEENLEEDSKILIGFKAVYVFDLRQTDGESLPKPHN